MIRRLEAEKRQDQEEIATNRRQVPRNQDVIEDYLWAFEKQDNPPWIQGRSETILRHLAKCRHVDPNTRDQAQKEKVDRRMVKSPSRPPQSTAGHPSHYSPVPQPSFYAAVPGSSYGFQSSGAGPSSIPPASNSFTGPSLSTPQYSPAFPSQSPQSTYGLFHTSLPSTPVTPYYPSPLNDPRYSGLSSNTPPLSPLDTGMTTSIAPPQKRQKRSRYDMPHSVVPEWNTARQVAFESRVARITASCGFPLRWVEDPEWLGFLDDFIPQAISRSRRVLGDRLIPAEVEKYRAAARKESHGLLATLQCDGWTGVNFHHFLAFMMTTSKRQVHTVRVFDTSTERKTADKLLAKIVEVKDHVTDVWKVTLVAITSDASGESRKARLEIVKLFPELVAPDCYGHQINLVVGDYLKAPYTVILLAVADAATELIGTLRGKTFVLAKLRGIQEANSRTILSVIRAVLTRWTAHYLAFRRLLQIKWALELMARQDAELPVSEIVTGKREAKEKTRKMLDTIGDATFWHNLARLKKHLEPLALAANITQIAHVRPDQVLIVFGLLHMEYQALKAEDTDPDSRYLIDTIIDSIEKRWAKSEQDVFIAAVILNPVYKMTPFDPIELTTVAGVLDLLTKLYVRFFGTMSPEVSQQFYEEVEDYLYNTGRYKSFDGVVEGVCGRAKAAGKLPDPLDMWKNIQRPDRPLTPLQRLAERVHSICANSASCERLFSMFGITLTRLRSRLRPKSLVNLAELRLHLRDEHLRSGLLKERLKRKMTTHHSEAEEAATAGATMTSDETESMQEDDAADPSAAPESTSNQNSFRNLTQRLTTAESEDDGGSSGLFSRRIENIFDFNNKLWAKIAKETALRGLDEELELYELLDLDASGDDDLESVLDEMTEASLSI